MTNSTEKYKMENIKKLAQNADEKIRQMKPTPALIEYYQNKIFDLKKNHKDLEEQLEMCKKVCENNWYSQEELLKTNKEVAELKKSVSDLQVFLYQEREHVLQLAAENDKLRLLQLDYQTKVDTLLSFAGLPKDFITFLTFQPNQECVVPKKGPAKVVLKNSLKKGRMQLINEISKGQVEIDKLHNQALMAELQDQSELFRDEIHSLLLDRDLRQKEWSSEQQKLQEQIANLNNLLKSVQASVCDDSERLLKMEKRHRTKEDNWMEEKANLLKYLETSHEAYHSVPYRYRHMNSHLDTLRKQLSEKDKLLSTYEEQNAALEQAVDKVREQMENNEMQHKKKCAKLMEQVKYLKQKSEDEKHRRLLDAEGFRNDIKFLRNRVQTLERKVFSHLIPSSESASNKDTR